MPSGNIIASEGGNVRLKSIAHAMIATLAMTKPVDLSRGVTNVDLAIQMWDHAERLAVNRARRNSQTEARALSLVQEKDCDLKIRAGV